MRHVLSDRALDDLADIYNYVAAKNPIAAESLVAAITAKIVAMAAAGNSGVARDDILPGLRARPFRQRCIYFRVIGSEFYVLRVLHGRQDVGADLFKDEN
ncbi:type II toxin-antitoxin system RelE/ParE family toxin [Rhizobium sp. TH2]|nr:type II toxin-antitoxin system RelE/ParE family toxin [Rhizobium sp. TH2]